MVPGVEAHVETHGSYDPHGPPVDTHGRAYLHHHHDPRARRFQQWHEYDWV